MNRSICISLFGLLLLAAPAEAGAFNAEVNFVTRISLGNLAATAESRLAVARAKDPKVRDFAQRMLDDRNREAAALATAAGGSGARSASALDADGQKSVVALQGKSGAAFDKAYIADQVAVLSNALTFYADYMLLGDNEKLKALAIRTIPVEEAQLKEAQKLDGD